MSRKDATLKTTVTSTLSALLTHVTPDVISVAVIRASPVMGLFALEEVKLVQAFVPIFRFKSSSPVILRPIFNRFTNNLCVPVVPCNEVNNCSPHAQCLYDPSVSDYRCRCNRGYDGDGIACTPRGMFG